MRITLEKLFIGLSVLITSFVLVGCSCKTIIYSIDKEEKEIWIWERDNEEYLTWYDFPVTQLYALNDKYMICEDSKVEEQLTVGWYLEPVTKIYSLTEEKIIPQAELQSLLDTGEWYQEPQIILYSPEGNKEIIPLSQKESFINKGYTVNYIAPIPKEKVGKSPFLKSGFSAEQLEKCLDKGLKGYGKAFYNMEQTYGINAVFAISVAELESGSGTSSAFRKKNNAFGIGPGKYFNSVEEGINYFGNLMNKSIYKNKSIDAIGSIYCVGGNWAYKVKSLFNENYAQIGA